MRVPDLIPKSVSFLMYRRKGQEAFTYAGTCFLVQYPLAKVGKAMQYMVTAYHVLANVIERSEDGKVFIRTNLPNGDVANVESHVSWWIRHESDSSVDVAVTPWYPRLADDTPLTVDLIPIGTDLFGTPAKLAEDEIGIGDDVFVTGLFSRFVGTGKNMPIVRMGSIAMMPDEAIRTKKFGNIEGFLIELRSSGGSSGSPVFAFHLGRRLVGGRLTETGIFCLMGLVHGHWDTPVETPKEDAEFESERFNLGIAVAIPAQKILEVLNHPTLTAMRKEIDEKGRVQLTQRGAWDSRADPA